MLLLGGGISGELGGTCGIWRATGNKAAVWCRGIMCCGFGRRVSGREAGFKVVARTSPVARPATAALREQAAA